MNDYWCQLEHMGTALSPVLTLVGGWGAVAVRDPGAIAASGQDMFTPTTVSVKQTVEPAQTVLSSSCITGEGKSDFTRLAYHTLDDLQSVSLLDVCDTSKQG